MPGGYNPNAQQFPNCYKGIPEATYIYLENIKGNWYVTGLKRDRCGTGTFPELDIPDDAKDAIVKLVVLDKHFR